jgi:hypothetical protein
VSPIDVTIHTPSSVGSVRLPSPVLESRHETCLGRRARGGRSEIESGRLLRRRQKTSSRPRLGLLAVAIRNRSVARTRRARSSFLSKVTVCVCCKVRSKRMNIDQAILLQLNLSLRDVGIYELACVSESSEIKPYLSCSHNCKYSMMGATTYFIISTIIRREMSFFEGRRATFSPSNNYPSTRGLALDSVTRGTCCAVPYDLHPKFLVLIIRTGLFLSLSFRLIDRVEEVPVGRSEVHETAMVLQSHWHIKR